MPKYVILDTKKKEYWKTTVDMRQFVKISKLAFQPLLHALKYWPDNPPVLLHN